MPLQLRQSCGNGKGKTLTHHCALIAALKPTFSLLRRFSTILIQWGEIISEEAFLFLILLHFHKITVVISIKSADFLISLITQLRKKNFNPYVLSQLVYFLKKFHLILPTYTKLKQRYINSHL